MRPLIVALALAGLAAGASARPARNAAMVLGTSNDAFTVNGQARFLVFASYFDALDAVTLDADLDYLADRVDGVRIFANWWDFANTPPCRLRFSPGTLIAVSPVGRVSVRPNRLARLQHVLDAAAARGLLVDLTFAAEPVEGLSRLAPNQGGAVCPPADFTNVVRWREYAPAVAAVASALSGPRYRHVLFDLQNEAGHRMNGATRGDLRLLVDAVRQADPSRLLSVSMFDPVAAHQVDLVGRLRLACVNFHDWPRGPGWGSRTGGEVAGFREALERAGLGVPIYAGEPDADAYGQGTSEFRASLAGARQAGGAAWTFHNRAAHDLSKGSLWQALGVEGRAFLDGLEGPAADDGTSADRGGALGVN